MSSTPDPALVADRLHSAAIHLLRALRQEDAEAGLSPARLSALSVLVFRGPASLGELAAAEQVQPPTMSRLVAALERDGLVRRAPDPEDRRAVRLAATARGARLLRAGRARRVARLARWLAGRSRAERRTLAAAAALIEDLLGESAPRPEDPRTLAPRPKPGTRGTSRAEERVRGAGAALRG